MRNFIKKKAQKEVDVLLLTNIINLKKHMKWLIKFQKNETIMVTYVRFSKNISNF